MSPTVRAARAAAGRLGGLTRWSRETDRLGATERMRKAADDRFLRQVQEEYPDLPLKAQLELAASRRRLFYVRIGRMSAAARRARTKSRINPA